MRHQIVTRVVVAFAVVLAMAVVTFAWLTTRPAPPASGEARVVVPPPVSGAELFARHCGACHEADETGIEFREAADRPAALERFRALLDDHYAPSPDAATAIAEYVIARPLP